MPDPITQELCVFSMIHSSALAGANTVPWVLGMALGVVLAAVLSSRHRPMNGPGDHAAPN